MSNTDLTIDNSKNSSIDTISPSNDNKIGSYSLEILKIIKESQQQHGLRHSDYQRYRAYCSRRIRRLRKTLHLLCGNQRKYQKRELTSQEINDPKYLLIPLFQAERAWSYAIQLKQEANSEPRKKYHLINRLRKAIKYSIELEKLSSDSKYDARSKLEAQGYNSWMNGQFYFEIQKWEESFKYFNTSKEIYEKLSSALADQDLKTLYLQRVGEFAPNIRYCEYNIRNDESVIKDLAQIKLMTTDSELANNIDSLISQTKEKQIKTLSEITWNQTLLQVNDEKVRLFLLNVQEYDRQIQSTTDIQAKLSIYENILKESVDAIQILRDELKADNAFKALQRGQKLEEKPSNMLLLFSYLSYIRLSKTIERNIIMISSLKENLSKQTGKPQDIVRIYDIIIQNYNEISNLPGIAEDKKQINDNDFYVSYFNAFRSYYISLFYFNNKKYIEAAGLSLKTDNYIEKVKNKLKNRTEKSQLSNKEIQESLDTLISDNNNLKYKIQTNTMTDDSAPLINEPESQKSKDKLILSDNLEKYYDNNSLNGENVNIVRMPVQFQEIPCKALFFDLALNHMELPSLEDKIEQKKQASSSVKTFFKGFFGYS